jgi:hypothetical protein
VRAPPAGRLKLRHKGDAYLLVERRQMVSGVASLCEAPRRGALSLAECSTATRAPNWSMMILSEFAAQVRAAAT